MKEQQSTTTDSGKISGDFIICLSDVTINDFLKFRGQVRILSEQFSGISHSQTIINEKALIMENRLDRHPEEKIIIQPSPALPDNLGGAHPKTFPPVAKKPAEQKTDGPEPPSKTKTPYMHRHVRDFMMEMTGRDFGTIIAEFRKRFRRGTKISDADIRGFYNRAHGVRE